MDTMVQDTIMAIGGHIRTIIPILDTVMAVDIIIMTTTDIIILTTGHVQTEEVQKLTDHQTAVLL